MNQGLSSPIPQEISEEKEKLEALKIKMLICILTNFILIKTPKPVILLVSTNSSV